MSNECYFCHAVSGLEWIRGANPNCGYFVCQERCDIPKVGGLNVRGMIAGPDLDALVAEKVMGLKTHKLGDDVCLCDPKYTEGAIFCHSPLPRYSRDIAEAWKVLMAILAKTRYAKVTKDDRDEPGMWWQVAWSSNFKDVECSEGELPLIICRAALKAVSV